VRNWTEEDSIWGRRDVFDHRVIRHQTRRARGESTGGFNFVTVGCLKAAGRLARSILARVVLRDGPSRLQTNFCDLPDRFRC